MGAISGMFLRVVPMFCMIFMTLFGEPTEPTGCPAVRRSQRSARLTLRGGARAGKKIASVVRIATVFAASSIPILMATLGPHQDDPTLPVGCAARHFAPRPSSGRTS